MIVLVNANNKGGVGKTTTSHNLASFLARHYKFRVLAIDMDQQMNLTDILKMKGEKFSQNVCEIFRSNPDPEDIIYKSRYENIYMIPASRTLIEVENEIAFKKNKEFFLKQWLIANSDVLKRKYQFDIVIIDCAPDVGNIEKNAFEAADTIIIVLKPSEQAIRGLMPFAKKLAAPKESNAAVILYNEYDPQNRICNEITSNISNKEFPFYNHLIKAFIPKHEAIERSNHKECIPIAEYEEQDFDQELNPYRQYNLFIEELKERGII